MNSIMDKYQRWFVYDYYIASGRPKMEDALMEIARKKWLYRSIYESDLKNMGKVMNQYQERLYNENKRLKKVNIGITDTRDKLCWLKIGEQSLRIRKIEEELEYVE